jgi:hypothetical protein
MRRRKAARPEGVSAGKEKESKKWKKGKRGVERGRKRRRGKGLKRRVTLK